MAAPTHDRGVGGAGGGGAYTLGSRADALERLAVATDTGHGGGSVSILDHLLGRTEFQRQGRKTIGATILWPIRACWWLISWPFRVSRRSYDGVMRVIFWPFALLNSNRRQEKDIRAIREHFERDQD